MPSRVSRIEDPLRLAPPWRLLILLAALATVLGPPSLRAAPSLGLPVDIVVEAPPSTGAFPLVTADRAAPLWYDANDYPGVLRALGDLGADIERVTGRRPAASTTRPAHAPPVIVGTIGKSAVIDSLVASPHGEIPDYGRGASAMSIFPVTADSILPPHPAPRLEYPVFLPRAGSYEVTLVLGPVMDFVPNRGMRIALAFDDQTQQVVDIFADRAAETFLGKSWWSQFTRDNARHLRSSHTLATPGPHLLKVSMVDPGIVLQEVIISDTKLPESYFGPPEARPAD